MCLYKKPPTSTTIQKLPISLMRELPTFIAAAKNILPKKYGLNTKIVLKGKVFEGRTRLRFLDDLSLIFLYQFNHLFWKIRRERTRVMSSTLMSRRTLAGSLSSIAIMAWVS